MFTCKTCGEQAGFTADWPTRVIFCSCYTNAFTAERDRLAAENAELRKQVEDWKTGSTHEAHYGDEARCELAAANATLDKLREAVGTDKPLLLCLSCDDWHNDEDPESGECPDCGGDLTTDSRALQSIWHILYPQPENES